MLVQDVCNFSSYHRVPFNFLFYPLPNEHVWCMFCGRWRVPRGGGQWLWTDAQFHRDTRARNNVATSLAVIDHPASCTNYTLLQAARRTRRCGWCIWDESNIKRYHLLFLRITFMSFGGGAGCCHSSYKNDAIIFWLHRNLVRRFKGAIFALKCAHVPRMKTKEHLLAIPSIWSDIRAESNQTRLCSVARAPSVPSRICTEVTLIWANPLATSFHI